MKLPVRPLDKILYQPLRQQNMREQAKRTKVLADRREREKARGISKLHRP